MMGGALAFSYPECACKIPWPSVPLPDTRNCGIDQNRRSQRSQMEQWITAHGAYFIVLVPGYIHLGDMVRRSRDGDKHLPINIS